MNYLVSLVALASAFKRGVGGGCFWINSHKESGSRLLSRSTAEGPSHQKLMSYLDHAVSSALCSENTAGLEGGVVGGRVHPPPPLTLATHMCVLYMLSVAPICRGRSAAQKEQSSVIVSVQLFTNCSVEMVDIGCKAFFFFFFSRSWARVEKKKSLPLIPSVTPWSGCSDSATL